MQRRNGLWRLVAALAIAAFSAAFAGLSVQLAAGDDPALSRTKQPRRLLAAAAQAAATASAQAAAATPATTATSGQTSRPPRRNRRRR
ncbi:MAG TPA: hypothetical protein VII98_01935 [Solirubrobacteraceae bacterium]